MAMKKIRPLLALLSLTVASSAACGGEEFPVLFDEDGTWALTQFDPDGDGVFEGFTSDTRRDKFMINFRRTSGEEQQPAGKLAAATCVDINGDSGIETSQCNQAYACRCFEYTYDGEQMVWREYMGEGETLYVPEEGEPAPGDPVVVNLSSVEGTSKTFVFKPLPLHLFDSDGTSSSYQFQQRAKSFFDTTPCSARCFGDAPM